MSTVTFKITKQRFFNNGNLILPHICVKSGKSIEDAIKNWLCQRYTLTDKPHKSKVKGNWDGLDAADINKQLRERMSSIEGIHGETHVEYGGLFHNSKEGFDFSLYDEDYNYNEIRNYFIGSPGIYKGDDFLENQVYKKLKSPNDNSGRMKKKEWKQILSKMDTESGFNTNTEKKSFTVVGEIQFGNWALGEHDLFRLINSSIKSSIDFYIYIAPTGNLTSKLSDGIVTYDKIIEAIVENSQLLSIPMWIIGLDLSQEL